MIHDGRVVGLPLVDYLDTKANIEALSGLEQGMIAYASDTSEFGAYDSTVWHWSRLDIDYLTGATYVSTQSWLNNTQSAGHASGGVISAHSDAITAANAGGAGAGSFEVAGDQTAGYPAAVTITVSGSTGNDGDYTVSAGGATYAGGTTTIPVDEAVPDGTADGDIANGRIDISAIKGFLKTTDDELGDTKSFDLAATTNFALTDALTNYVFVNYVGGPKFDVTTTRSSIELNRQFTIGRVYRDGNTLHLVHSGVHISNFLREEHERTLAVRGFERASGGTISETGERYLESQAGVFYLGTNDVTTTGVDTSGAATFTRWYHSGGTWASDQKSQICEAAYQYDDGTDLANVTKYGVWWVFVHFDSDLHVVVGRGNYTLAEAQAATLSTTPNAVSDFSTLAAKIIVKNNGTNFAAIQSAYDIFFPLSGALDHNDLGSIQGGAADEHYHFTNAQHTALSAMVVAGLEALTAGEVNQLENIGVTTISAGQWVYLGAMDQGVAQANSPTFADVFVPDGGTFGITGNELIAFNAAGNATFSGVTSVVVPDGCWVGADAACSWIFDSTNGDVTTLGKVGIGTDVPGYDMDIVNLADHTRLAIRSYSATDAHSPDLFFMKSHSNTAAPLVATTDADVLGDIRFHGVDTGPGWAFGARMYAIQRGVAGAAFVETDLILYTHSTTGANSNQLYLDGGTGRVGVGTAETDTTLHVHRASAGVVAGTDGGLVVENSAVTSMSLLFPNNQYGQVLWGSPSDAVRHGILAFGDTHAWASQMRFYVNNAYAVIILPSGYAGFGGTPATLVEMAEVEALTGALADGYAACLTLDPGYDTGAHAVTRHNYIDVNNPSVADGASVTAAAVMRFNAAIGTHKALAAAFQTLDSSAHLTSWAGGLLINVNGTLYKIPMVAA